MHGNTCHRSCGETKILKHLSKLTYCVNVGNSLTLCLH
jgi:hypothetical protein